MSRLSLARLSWRVGYRIARQRGIHWRPAVLWLLARNAVEAFLRHRRRPR